MDKKRLIMVGCVAIDVVVLVVYIVLLILKLNRTVILDVNVVPSMAKVVIGGTEYASGVYKVYPGEVEVEIKADGFESKNLNVKFLNHNITKIYDYLMPDQDNLSYYSEHEDDVEALKKIGGDDALKMLKIISIKNVLPIVDYKYGGLNGTSREIVINESYECETYFCLTAIGNFENENVVKNLIRAKGYDPADYEIKYEKR